MKTLALIAPAIVAWALVVSGVLSFVASHLAVIR